MARITTITAILVFLSAMEHIFIFVLEMFFSESRIVQKNFNLDLEYLKDERTKIMLANQAVYNGFLASGLLWSLGTSNLSVAVFFLLCVVCAAVYGAVTVNKRILLIQGGIAILGLISVFL